MWNMWYLVIAFIALGIGFAVWAIVLRVQSRSIWETDNELQIVGAVIFSIVAIILLLVALFIPMEAKREIEEFRYVSEMTVQSIENGSDIENLAITTKVIEMNQWLAEVKATKYAYGNWTIYNTKGISDAVDALVPISVLREKGGG